MPANLLYIGSPLLDVVTHCDAESLARYGLELDGCVRTQEDEHDSLFASILSDPRATSSPGGSAQNSARASRWVLGARGSVAFAGCVGSDEAGRRMDAQLWNEGVVPLYTIHETLPTGVCACLVGDGGRRSMVTRLGASATLNASHIAAPLTRGADVVYAPGFLLSHSPDALLRAARSCHELGKLFAFNLSASFVCASYRDELLACLALADVVFGNVAEARELCPVADAKMCAASLAALPKKGGAPRIAVVSDGPSPLAVCVGTAPPRTFPVPHVSDLRDAVGCGDALVGGFLAALHPDASNLDEAIRIGTQVAVQVARASGFTLPAEPPDFR